MKKIRTIVLYSVIALPVFLALVAAFTQTQMFRDRLRTAALGELDSLLNADVRLGSLTGNLISGFSIDSVAIDVDGQPFLRLDRLELAYDLFGLPGKNATIRRLTMNAPRLFFYRPRGGQWNVAKMIRGNSSGSTPFDWVINALHLEIRDGTVSLLDSASLAEAEHPEVNTGSIEYHLFTLHRVNLVLAAEIRKGRQRVVIQSCSFVSDQPDFRLKQLSGVLSLSPSEARVDSLHIVTGKSSIALNASMKEVNLMEGIELRSLQSAPVELSLNARPVDFEELKSFLTPLEFLSGKADLAVRATGQFGELVVRQLDVHTGSSSLFLRGRVNNLHDPRKLALDVKLTESTLKGEDISALMPGFDLPDLSPLGTMTLNMEFEGSPLEFRTKFLLETAAGRMQSSGLSLGIGGLSVLGYDGTLLFSKLDLGRALGDDRLSSNLNGTLMAKGRGIDISRLAAAFALQVDSSEFRGLPLTGTNLTLEATRQTLSAHGKLSLGEMSANLAGEVQKRTSGMPAFHLEGNVSSLNLAQILHDTTYDSDITMKLKTQGTGLSLNSLSDTTDVDLSSSRYREYTVDQGIFRLALDQRDSTAKRLKFDSNIADLTITGAFDLGSMIRLLPFEFLNLRAAILERISAIDPSLAVGIDRAALGRRARALAADPSRMDARYSLLVKDLEPLSVAAGNKTFDGSGLVTGSIRGGYPDASLTCDLTVDDFFYGTADAGVLIEDGKAALDIQSLKPDFPLEKTALKLSASAGKVHVNRNALDSLDVAVEYAREKAVYAVLGVLNNTTRVQSAGTARVDENSVTVSPESLDLSYQNFLWRAEPGAVLRVNHVGASLANLVLRRDSEEVTLDASLGAGRSVAASLAGTHLDLDGLKYFLAGEEPGPPGKAFSGGAWVQAKASGTLMDPLISASVGAENVTFRSLPFGGVAAELRYEKHAIEGHVRVTKTGAPADSTPVMTIDGTVPVDLGLEGAGDTLAVPPMNLRVVSNGVQMNILEPLLPTFGGLTGLMACDLSLSGSPRQPAYDGTITISRCSFLFVPNNISYTLEGTFRPEGDRIKVVDCVVRNLPEDEQSGRKGEIHLAGDFALRDFRPGNFNLEAVGQLLVVKETTAKSSLAVSGYLFGEIGPGPLRFTGDIENSLLKGSLRPSSALVFPPAQSSVAEESAQSVPVVFVNDTLKVNGARDRSAIARYFGETGAAPAADQANGSQKSKSFIEGLRYDLDIDATGGNNEIRMVFNPATNEELVATIDGKFTITGDGTRWTGDLTVVRAYYNFFKRFEATGSIRYTGDFMDPELDISATYQGTRTIAPDSGKTLTEKVVVTVTISGSRKKPKVDFSMTIDDVDYYSYRASNQKSNDLQSDAIQFIVGGAFPLTNSQKSDLASETGYSLLTGASSMLTGRLSDFLRAQTGFINTLELNYGTGSSPELRLSGTAFRGYWNYKGTFMNDPLSNSNINMLYSLGTIFNNPDLRNLMFELERRVEPTSIGVATDPLKKIDSARLYYRFSF